MAAYGGKSPSLGEDMQIRFLRWGKKGTTRFCYSMMALSCILLLIVLGIIVMVRGVHANAIAVSENVHEPTAIRRSFELTRERFWETSLVFLVEITVCFGFILSWRAMGIGVYLYDEQMLDGPNVWIVEAGLSLVIGLVSGCWHIALYCWYRDLLQKDTLTLAQPFEDAPDENRASGTKKPEAI